MAFSLLKKRLWLMLITLLIGSTAIAQQDQPSVFFNALKTLQASFSQTVYDESGRALEQSSGEMFMQRPGQFRWEYRDPYSQLIVADGERVWLYDRDLEQITVRRMSDTLSAAPLAMLGVDVPLSQTFTITRLGQREGLTWYALKPKQASEDVSFIRLGFNADQLQQLEIEDSLRRLTRMNLTQVQRNPTLRPALFDFTPPEGVDVLGDS